jgi:hypothetical protein
MSHSDPEMPTLWSPLSREGLARFASLRAALRSAYAPPSHAQRLQRKYAAGARRGGDAIFFETFGAPEQLLRMGVDDELCAELFAPPARAREPEPEPSEIRGHVSRLARPTRLPTPTRFSLKRPRADDESSETLLPVRKPRLSDTTNLPQTATMKPWDRYHPRVLKPSAATSVSRVEARPFQPVTTAAFAPRPHPHTTSTRAFALR